MIITAPTGQVYTVDSSGNVIELANVNALHENPEVVPASFGPLGGQIWTAAENIDTVFAISATGTVTAVGTSSTYFDGAETVHLIPSSVCNFGNSGGAFFVTDTFNAYAGGHVVKFPASDFAGLGGDVLVAGEHGNPIARIAVNGAGDGYDFSIFDATVRHHEGATFARCITVPTTDNLDPDCTSAVANPDTLWPPNHKMRSISVTGVTDADLDPISINIDSIRQDEKVDEKGSGNFSPDGKGVGTDTASVRAERVGNKKTPGDGRVYHIGFTASDGQGGECTGVVKVGVPHDQGKGNSPVDGGALYDSTVSVPGTKDK